MKGVGAAVASVGAAALAHLPCCGLPLVLGVLGASTGAAEMWLHGPLRWLIVTFSLVMSALSLWLVFRKKKRTCACDEEACVHERKAHWWPKAFVVALTVVSLYTLFAPAQHDHSDHTGHSHAGHVH